MMIKILSLYFLLLFSFNVLGMNEIDTKIFIDSNTLYDKGDYKSALSKYHELIDRYPKSGELYYNLANAYYKNGELGKSIFFYIKARKILPRHGDVKYNLEYARNQKIDKQENNKDLLDLFNIPFNEDELLILVTVFALFFWSIMIISLYRKNFIIISTRYIAIILLFLTGTLLTIHTFSKKEIGVITSPEASVFSTIGVDSIKLFTLHEGSEVVVVDKKDNWILVTLGENRKGWIPSDKIIN